jgi:hypothetical protein
MRNTSIGCQCQGAVGQPLRNWSKPRGGVWRWWWEERIKSASLNYELVLAKNTIRKNIFWIYSNIYEYDKAPEPLTEYEYDQIRIRYDMDIIRYGPNRIQIYLSTVKHGFGRLGTLTAPVGSANPTWKSGSENRCNGWKFQPLHRFGSASSRTLNHSVPSKRCDVEVGTCRPSR